MSEMLERVARAICRVDDGLPDSPQELFDVATEAQRIHYRAQASAAIEAMKEPTEAMVNSGELAAENAYNCYRRMIDVALGIAP